MVLLTALVLFFSLALAPTWAFAKDYSIDSVTIEATIETNGDLVVKEAREFNFDGSFHGVYWKIPTGSYNGRSIDTSILSVGEYIDGQFVEFQNSDSETDHTYQLSETSDYVQVKLFSSHEDERATFGLSYRDTGLATRYQDVSELYWKFVSDGWDVESQNVNCTIKLPVPDGATVTGGENVRAWGHGPLDANVGFEGNTVVYKVPGVGSSEFAEARITFPQDWLSEAAQDGSSRLDSVLSEEQVWADEANAKRGQARMLMGGATAAGCGISVLALVFSIFNMLRYKRSHKAQFDDKYFRDVPSDDHPAVLGTLLNDGTPTGECLTAALMRLTDQHAVKLEQVKTTKKGLFGREKEIEDYCLTPLTFMDRPTHAIGAANIDYETMRFMFQRVAPLAARVTGDADRVYFNSLESVARKSPERYHDYYEIWSSAVEAECQRRNFFRGEGGTGKWPSIIAGVLSIMVGIASFFALFAFGSGIVPIVATLLLSVGGGLACIFIGTQLDSLSPEAIELKAKLVALRNWLEDFTRLDEAIPQDVVLWNRLLVMAVVLGVSEQVIKQLKMAAPQILEDPMMAPTYGWYYYGGPSMPSRAFTDSISNAHSVSTAALADSSSSSGGGGGGGFSGGGGGGFGGGGGGGAF